MKTRWNSNLIMTRAQMRSYDRIAIEEVGISGPVLMENAGRAVAKIAIRMLNGRQTVAVIAGPGNNGGDGFVVARHLMNMGLDVTVHLAVGEDKITGDALLNYNILKKMNADIEDIARITALIDLKSNFRKSALIIDALLGTGVTRPVDGHLGDIIEIMNDSGVPILSVDVPSGLDADRGVPAGVAVQATETATFGHYKTGLLLHPGAELAGKCHVIPLGVPAFCSTRAGFAGELLSEEGIRGILPSRPREAHKGTFGHLVVMAGSMGKSGAAVLTAQAAMRVGTGLVTIATTNQAQQVIEPRCMEVMVEGIMDKTEAAISEKTLKRLEGLMDRKTALAIGPGLSTAPGISSLAIRFLQLLQVPAVIDADGINILAADPSGAARIKANLIFTPHPGEMARLVDKTVLDVQTDRIQIARNAAEWHKAVFVLKGTRTIIASPDGRIFINPTGNPGMASGGTGDVLTGMIGGFLAQGLSTLNAAVAGTYLHGLAGDAAAESKSMAGLIASDIIDAIPIILKRWSC